MIPNRVEQFENLIVDRLCAYQSRLDEGEVAGVCSEDDAQIPDEIRPIMGQFRRCLNLLHEVRVQLIGASPSSSTQEYSGTSQTYPIPSRIGRFKITGQLGIGGFGIVFRGVDPVMGREVAIKIPRPEFLASAESIARFAGEAAAAAQLEHPNILPVFESHRDGIVPYIVTPFISGETLAQWRAGISEISPRTAAEIVRQLALGVAHAHERGVLHRDITPGNVLLAAHEEVAPGRELPFVPKLTDFGLAKCAETDVHQTQTGTIIGTACYMSPEQARGRSRDITARSDVYGLGAVLYELLTGAPPFRGKNPLQTIQNILHDEPLSVQSIAGKVPIDLEVICLNCLEKVPANRYESARALAEDLQRFLNHEPIRARSISRAARFGKWCRRHPARTAAISAALLGLITIVGISFWYNARLTQQLEIIAQKEKTARQHELEARRRAYVSDMRNAKIAFDQTNLTAMLKLLDRYQPRHGEPDLRDFAWWYLWREYHDASRVFGTHADGASAVAITRKGDLAASGGADSVIRLWSIPDGKLVAELRGHESGTVESADFSPTGERLVSAGEDGTVRIWDTVTFKQLFVRREHQSMVSQAVYSPSGDLIASGAKDNMVRLWDPETGEPKGVLPGHTARVRCLAFHPLEPTLVTGSLDGTIRFWNLNERAPDVRLKDGMIRLSTTDQWPRALVLGPDSKRLVAGTIAGTIIHFSLVDETFGEEIVNYTATNLRCLIWPRDGHLMGAMGNSEIRIAIDRGLTESSVRFRGHLDTVLSIASTPDAKNLVSASSDGSVRCWPQFPSHLPISAPATDRTEPREPFLCSVRWRGHYLAVDFQQRQLMLYRMPERTLEKTFPKDNDDEFVLSSSGERLLLISGNGDIKCVRVADGRTLWTQTSLSARSDFGRNTVIDKDDKLVGIACGSEVALLSMHDSSVIHRLKHPKRIEAVAFVETRGTPLSILTACADHMIRIWDAETGELLRQREGHGGSITAIALSDDYQTAATGGDDHRIRIWQLADLTELYEIPSVDGSRQLGFLAGGEILIRRAPIISFWSVRHEAELLAFPERTTFCRFEISPDGNQVAIVENGSIRIIDGRPMR